MIFALRLPLAVGVCTLTMLGGCAGGDDSTADKVAYSADPASEPTDMTPEEGIDDPVEMTEQVCYSNDFEDLDGVHPAGWEVDPNGPGRCSWSDPRSGTLEFVYDGDIAGDEVWEEVLSEHNAAGMPDSEEIPGYEFTQITRSDKSGNPLWHYQYIDDRGGGPIYVDSFNLYRGQWRVTYEAESSEFNQYIAEQLEAKIDVSQ